MNFNWVVGMDGYIGIRYIGAYVGENPHTGSLVFVTNDNEYKAFHPIDIQNVSGKRSRYYEQT